MKVQLVKPHTHGRVAYQPDDVIEVSDAEAAWLKAHGIVQQNNKKARWLKSVPDSNTVPDEEAQQ